jgi:GNAT superfamily N-acetyltransferase
MTAETLIGQPMTLSERCTDLIPGFWGGEDSCLIKEAEIGDFDVAEVRFARCLAFNLARETLAQIDSDSEHGQRLAAFIEELGIKEGFEWPTIDSSLKNNLEPSVRIAWSNEADRISDIGISRARSMAPGDAYAVHAAANEERLLASGSDGVARLIERSRKPKIQLAAVARLKDFVPTTKYHDQIGGYIFARWERAGSSYYAREHVLIHGIAVDEDQLHRGIGRALLRYIEDWQEAMFMDLPVCAQVADTNTPMLNLLERHHFEHYGTEGPTANNPVRYETMLHVNPTEALIAV